MDALAGLDSGVLDCLESLDPLFDEPSLESEEELLGVAELLLP